MGGSHRMYSKKAEKVMAAFLRQRLGEEESRAALARLREIYLGFLETLPDLGGKKNPQAGAVYDSIALFALWEALEEKPTLEEFEQLNEALFVPQYRNRLGLSLNWPWAGRVAHKIFCHVANVGKRGSWPGNYHMEVEPYDPEVGIRYSFRTCPIADFARAHGYLELMPALCNADYPMLACLHGGLIRTTTCANGDRCDYWIVGDRSRWLEEHPRYRDEAGYLRNR